MKSLLNKSKLLFIVLICCTYYTYGLSQNINSSKISINKTKVTLLQVFNEITNVTQFNITYGDYLANNKNKYDVNYRNTSIAKIMNDLGDKASFSFQVQDNEIIIGKKNLEYKKSQKQITITGVVSDEKGYPLIGVIIYEKGTENGTETDADGKFSLEVTDEYATLLISFLGFNTQEIPLNGQITLSVTLKEDATNLDEIVVLGYGEQTKRKVTSSVSTMKTDDVEDLPFNNMGDAISGRVSGLIINGGNTTPGSTPVISIRGGGSPLIVIDGIVTEDLDQFYALNPNDLENVSFLKDGAATAVFGARGSNGIILVTTKTGKGKGLNIEYSNNFAMTSPTMKRNFISSYEWGLAQNDAISLHDGTKFAVVSEEDLSKYRDQTDPINFPNSNWYDAVYNDWASQQRHHLSLGGESGKTNYYFSFGYVNQGSIYKSNNKSNFSQYNLITNISTKFDKIGLKTNIKINTIIKDIESPALSTWGITSHVQNTLPTSLIYNPDGTYSSLGEHPVAESDSNSGYDQDNKNFLNGQLKLIWDSPFVDGLSVSVMGNYKYVRERTKNWNAPVNQYDKDGKIVNSSKRPKLSQNNKFSGEYFVETQLNYEKSIGKHYVQATSLYSRNEFNEEEINATRINYVLRSVDQIFAGPTQGATSHGTAKRVAREAIIGLLNYGYAEKYYIEGSFRYDGSDNFAPDKRWGFFPSISVGWIISDENFMNFDVLSVLKLRTSYAAVGNDGTLETPEFPNISRLQYIRNYSLSTNVMVVDGELVAGFKEGNFPSPDMSWFTTEKYNYGMDFGFFDNKLNGTIDYFYNRTTGFLQTLADVYTTPLGKSLPAVKSDNAFRRHGIEASLNYRSKIGELHYEVGGNIVWNERLWEKYNEDDVQLKNPRTRVTQRKNTNALALTSLGLYQSVDEIINNPTWSKSGSGLRPGDIRYKDINGDGKIDDSDRTQQGKAYFPSLNFGFYIDLKYKAWSLETLFQGAGNRDIFLTYELINKDSRTITYDYQLDYWTPSNTDASYPRPVSTSTVNGDNNSQNSSFWLKNARYMRLKSIHLVYNFKKGKVLGSLNGISDLKISVSCTNLLTWSPIKDFIDPEDISARGFNYPLQKVISLGINASL